MSYLVLARKSRPQNFEQVVGQRPVVQTLTNSIARNRISHAILFSGVRGVGKTTLARIMAKAINCTAEIADRPCSVCSSCMEISNGSSLDIYEIDGASNRGIQEIRELKEKIRFLPTNSNFKVIIIDEVHMLTTEAFNALLKTLEEPPAHVHFMFATTEIHKIPITILSRCQQYELKRISANDLQNHFQNIIKNEGYQIDKEALSLIVRESGGSVRDGLSLIDQMFSFGEKHIKIDDVTEVLGLVSRDVILTLGRALLEGNRTEVFLCLDKIVTFGMDTRRFMEDLLNLFRSLLLARLDGCVNLIDLPEDDLSEIQELSHAFTTETLHLKLSLLMTVAEDLKSSRQPRIFLETSFLKIIEATNVAPLSSLLGHLEKIIEAQPSVDLPQLKADPVASPQVDQTEKKKASPLETSSDSKSIPEDDTQLSSEDSQPVTTPVSPPEGIYPPPPVDNAIPEASIDSQPTAEGPIQPQPKQTSAKVEIDNIQPDEIVDLPEAPQILIHPHEKDVRRDWPEFLEYVRDRKVWMAKDLQRADSAKEEEGDLQLHFSEGAICSLLRQKENLKLLNEFALDFFQKPLKVKVIIPDSDEDNAQNGGDSPQKKRLALANDPLVAMAADIFNGEVGDIRIGPRSR